DRLDHEIEHIDALQKELQNIKTPGDPNTLEHLISTLYKISAALLKVGEAETAHISANSKLTTESVYPRPVAGSQDISSTTESAVAKAPHEEVFEASHRPGILKPVTLSKKPMGFDHFNEKKPGRTRVASLPTHSSHVSAKGKIASLRNLFERPS